MSADYWPNFGYANRNMAGADEWDVPRFEDDIFSPSDYKYFERRYAGADSDAPSEDEGCDLESISDESMDDRNLDFEDFRPGIQSTPKRAHLARTPRFLNESFEDFQPALHSTRREPARDDIPEVIIPTQFRFPESRPYNYWEVAVPPALRPTREEYYRRIVPPELRSPLYVYPGTSNEMQNESDEEEEPEQSGGYMNRLRNFASNQARQWKNLYGRFF